MSSCASDEEHLVADAAVTVPESHSLFAAADEEHLVVDTPVLVVKNSLKFLLSVAGDELCLVLSAYLT